jgi:hypothetical protein
MFTGSKSIGAKLFTVGSGEQWERLSSPPVNNFGLPIRVARRALPWEAAPR